MEKEINKLMEALNEEISNRGSFSILRRFRGVPLYSIEASEEISVNHLQDNLTASENGSLVIRDVVTNLLLPGPSARMKLLDGTCSPVSSNSVIHPETGHIIPIEGNVAYDFCANKLVFLCDTTSFKTQQTSKLVPYIPYPIMKDELGNCIDTGLPVIENKTNFQLGSPMVDPASKLLVPTWAVTIHPQLHTFHAVGGTHKDPITNLLVPIELGAMMLDSETDIPVPILSVSFDPITALVIPIGGTRLVTEHQTETRNVILPDVIYTDPLSQLQLPISGAHYSSVDHSLVLEYGGVQNLLDTVELFQENEVLKALQMMQDIICTKTVNDKSFSDALYSAVQHLDQAEKNLSSARKNNQYHHLLQVHFLSVRKQTTEIIANTGGSPGCMEYEPTGQKLPLLLGSYMTDPGGSRLQVPILGYEVQPGFMTFKPLGGSMDSADGSGVIPITIGVQFYDGSSGNLATVCGVTRDKDTKVVVPMTQGLHTKKKRNASKKVVSVFISYNNYCITVLNYLRSKC